jgi:hypothetical protein
VAKKIKGETIPHKCDMGVPEVAIDVDRRRRASTHLATASRLATHPSRPLQR